MRHRKDIGVAIAMVAALLAPLRVCGHLSIIRQGPESRGAREADDRFGFALATGDFNGDGYVDLATGCPGENVEGNSILADAGAVVINYGSWTGLVPGGAQLLTQGALGFTDEVGDNFGFSLTVGNFNGDLYDDLAVGSPGESIGGNDDAGNVIIVLGSAAGLNFATAHLVSQANSPGAVEASDAFGFSLASGDYNGDDRDDLAVGIPGEDLELGEVTINQAGAVEFYFGSAGGITTAGAYILTDNDLPNPAETGALFGWSLAAGNFDADSYDDVAVGVPGKNTSGAPQHGVVFIVYGSIAGITPAKNQFFSQVSLGGMNETGDQFGFSLAAGRAGDDGYDDLAVGAPFKNNGIAMRGGHAYVSYGSAAGLRTDNPTVLNPASIFGSSTDDNFGWALAFGDWTGNGRDDLAVGIPGGAVSDAILTGVPFSIATNAGVVVVLNSDENGIVNSQSTRTRRTQAITNEVPENNDRFGAALAFGDFTGTGREALAIGSPFEDYDPPPGVGSVTALDIGSVHIDAPWIQPQNLTCRTSILVDCDGNIVFSQKPFERHAIASTTKIMTCVLAAEATQAGCGPCVDFEDDIYTFPTVFDDPANGGTIAGSLASMCIGELANLELLMYGLMLVSGNDAAFSIADLIVDQNTTCAAAGCTDVGDFVQMMNDRAADFGMSRTAYQNPSGGIHNNCGGPCWPNPNVSTAEDMAKLAHFAMQNPLVRQIVGTPSVNFVRVSPCVSPGVVQTWNSSIFIVPGASSASVPNGSGMKPGGNSFARRTFVATVDHPDGRLIAVALGSLTGSAACPGLGTVSYRTCDVRQLVDLGLAEFCDIPIQAPQPQPPGMSQSFAGIPTDTGSGHAIGMALGDLAEQHVHLRLGLSEGTPRATTLLRMTHQSELSLPPGASTRCALEPFESHDGIRITNVGANTLVLHFEMDPPPTNGLLELAPGSAAQLPAYSDDAVAPEFSITLHNDSLTQTADFQFVMHALSLNYAGVGPLDVSLRCDRRGYEDSINVELLGQDPAPGGAVDLLIAQTLAADGDFDGDLDMIEAARFQNCFSNDPTTSCADAFDFDVDAVVGPLDHQRFLEHFTGPALPAQLVSR